MIFFLFSVLLNKWEILLVKIGENIQHTEVYESLNNAEDKPEDDVELEQELFTFRVSEKIFMK